MGLTSCRAIEVICPQLIENVYLVDRQLLFVVDIVDVHVLTWSMVFFKYWCENLGLICIVVVDDNHAAAMIIIIIGLIIVVVVDNTVVMSVVWMFWCDVPLAC